jgi:hypothetical protein
LTGMPRRSGILLGRPHLDALLPCGLGHLDDRQDVVSRADCGDGAIMARVSVQGSNLPSMTYPRPNRSAACARRRAAHGGARGERRRAFSDVPVRGQSESSGACSRDGRARLSSEVHGPRPGLRRQPRAIDEVGGSRQAAPDKRAEQHARLSAGAARHAVGQPWRSA